MELSDFQINRSMYGKKKKAARDSCRIVADRPHRPAGTVSFRPPFRSNLTS